MLVVKDLGIVKLEVDQLKAVEALMGLMELNYIAN